MLKKNFFVYVKIGDNFLENDTFVNVIIVQLEHMYVIYRLPLILNWHFIKKKKKKKKNTYQNS